MHNFLLRNLDEHTWSHFQTMAKHHGRSLQHQFHLSLAQTIEPDLKDPFTLAEQIRSRLHRTGGIHPDSAHLVREDRTR